jgi:hypothetical protein
MPNKYDSKGKKPTVSAAKGLTPMEANKREILKKLAQPRNKGLIHKAVDGVCSEVTYKKYLREDADFKEKAEETIAAIRERIVEKVEERVFDAILDDDKPLSKNQTELSKMVLKNLGKDRGWTERQEIKQDGDGGQIKIEYVVPHQIDNIETQETIEIKSEEDEQSNNK